MRRFSLPFFIVMFALLGITSAQASVRPDAAPMVRADAARSATPAEKAIMRAGRLWLPGAAVAVDGCRRLSRRTVSCTLVEAGVPVVRGDVCPPRPTACAEFYGIRATRVGRDRVRVWSPFWKIGRRR
jgi:hypothetical protein